MKDASVEVSKSIYSKTKEGLSELMNSDAISNLKNKVFYFMNEENEERTEKGDESVNYNNFGERLTASTMNQGGRQSNFYRHGKSFY